MMLTASATRVQKIVTVNTSDVGGGAERMAWDLFAGYRRRGLKSWLVVGDKKTDDPQVMPFFASPNIDYRPFGGRGYRWQLQFGKWLDRMRGVEDFRFPYARFLLEMTGQLPDVVHCHNLHGPFFDLRVLPQVSCRVPVFLTLHDCWSLTGHCAYPLECDRWETGCGRCPALSAPPSIRRDATRLNWHRKRNIFARCQLYVATPSHWLMRAVQRSILAPGIVESRVIPNAVDLSIYTPGSRQSARNTLGIPDDRFLIAFAATRAKENPYKDYKTIRSAIRLLAEKFPQRQIQFVAIGQKADDEQEANALIRHIPMQSARQLARYFRASDVYAHAAKQETFGLVIAEAMACATPVVATNVGGISEVFRDGEHGLLVPPSSPGEMANALGQFLSDSDLRRRYGQQASLWAKERFAGEVMVNAYLNWFEQVCRKE